MTKNILVTGAKGQLGSELAEIHAQFPFRFFFTDVDTLDLTDKSAVAAFVARENIDYIVNCAAYTAVDKAEDDAALCWRINRDAVQNLAEAARGKAKIIHISTDYVFDGTASQPYKESDATNPQSVYGQSKLAGEEVLMRICPESIIIRTAWLYSAFGNNFVKTMIRLGQERPELNVVADQTGTPTNAADLAQASVDILLFSENKRRFLSGVYHYSDEGVTTWYDFAREVHRLQSITSCTIHPVTTDEYPTRAHRPKYSVLDKSKIKAAFGLTIPAWEDSLRRLLVR
jgi:dTDP-4-dehydrorhamnose reductase